MPTSPLRIPTSFMCIINSTHCLSVLVLQLVALLAIVPIISASPHSPRDLNLPDGWIPLDCITDNVQIPTLTGWGGSTSNMTVEWCVEQCIGIGLVYAGLENGYDCHCGNVLSEIAMNATETDCGTPCAGDSTEMCGSSLRLNLYWNSSATPQPPPTMVNGSSDGLWNLMGCYNDSNSQRVLQESANVTGGQFNTSVETCTAACYDSGFTVAGLEWATQCYCGHYISYPGMEMPDKDCSMPCSGNQLQICGGANRMTTYYYVIPY